MKNNPVTKHLLWIVPLLAFIVIALVLPLGFEVNIFQDYPVVGLIGTAFAFAWLAYWLLVILSRARRPQ